MSDSQSLKDFMMYLEEDTRYSTGVRYISGGYARAEMVSENDKYYFIDLHFGVVSDVEDRKYLEHYRILKKYFLKEISVEERFSKLRYTSQRTHYYEYKK